MPLRQLHESLGHPGFAWLYHFVRQRNLPYSREETKTVCRLCRTCLEIKPCFFKPPVQTLIKALRPWDCLSLDFKGPVRGACPYRLLAVDEYSRFPFVFPCKNMKSSTVIAGLSSLFCVLGFSSCIHNDRGSPFVSQETRTYLSARGISFSTSTTYDPVRNSQCERFNQTIWRTIQLFLHGRGLAEDRWKEVLAEALHAVRSLVCLSANETPHERLFRFPRRSNNGMALPSRLLTPGTVLLHRHVRNKGNPFCDPVELVEGNPTYSVVRLPDGRERTVSTSDLAPCPPAHNDSEDPPNTDCFLETDGVGGDDMGDGAADEAEGVLGGEIDESSVPKDIVNDR